MNRKLLILRHCTKQNSKLMWSYVDGIYVKRKNKINEENENDVESEKSWTCLVYTRSHATCKTWIKNVRDQH